MKITLSILIICISITCFAQWQESRQFEIEADKIALDELGNLYCSNENTFYKCNPEGEILYTYTNSFLGKIQSFDVSDPFKLLLFFNNFNQIVYLDNNLSELRTPISLDDLDLYEADAVCASHRGGFWVYLSGNSQLLRYNNNLQQAHQNNIIIEQEVNIENMYLMETAHFLILSLPPEGIFVYDGLGSFVKTIPAENAKFIQSEKQKLFYVEDNKLTICDLRTGKNEIIELPETNNLGVAYNNGSLYLLDSKKIRIFTKE